MTAAPSPRRLARLSAWMPPSVRKPAPAEPFGWRGLPRGVRSYVGAVIIVGAFGVALSFPNAWPHPWLFAAMIGASCVTSTWKVNLPISVSSGSTLSVSHATEVMSLVLLGPRPAVLTAVASAWMQCTFSVRQPNPGYRTVFSMAADALAMVAAGFAYVLLGGAAGPLDFDTLPKPLVGAIAP